MTDWQPYDIGSLRKVDFPALEHERSTHVATMDYAGDTNIGNGFMRFNRTLGTFDEYQVSGNFWQSRGALVPQSKLEAIENLPTFFHKQKTGNTATNPGLTFDNELTIEDLKPNTSYSVEAFFFGLADTDASGTVFEVGIQPSNVNVLPPGSYFMLATSNNDTDPEQNAAGLIKARGGQYTALKVSGMIRTNTNSGTLNVLYRLGSGASECTIMPGAWVRLSEIG